MRPVRSYLDNAGDGELRGVVFLGRNVKLSIRDPYYEKEIVITLIDVSILLFYTNHFQNVISEIYFVENLAFAELPIEARDIINVTLPTIDSSSLREDLQTLVIVPATGGDLIAQFARLEIEYERCDN